MAMAIMGGLIVGTVLTLVFVPALYAAWFRVRAAASDRTPGANSAAAASAT
jgi:multidrug efflux pump